MRTVVDGQQRLTTLQVLLHAAASVVGQHGNAMDAQALSVLVSNPPGITHDPDEQYKVWPTNYDRAAFRSALGTEPVPEELSNQLLVQAHRFFTRSIDEWAATGGDPEQRANKLNALTHALREHLKLVVIDLEPGDNAQVIFETLNHRGAALLAADLVKNLLFQAASTQSTNLNELYESAWKAFDDDYWRKPVQQGRRYRPRVDIFLNYWLIARTEREVSADRVFTEFRDYLHRENRPAQDVMRDLYADGRRYAELEGLAWDSALGTFYYRVVRMMDQAAVGPFLLWLLKWRATEIPAEQIRRALAAMESWLVRRTLCRITLKDVNRVVVELLRDLSKHPIEQVGQATEQFLARQHADARTWPNDEQLISELATSSIYTRLTRGRLRIILEALEDDLRGPMSEHERCPRGVLTIEHVMPQGWRENWGADIVGDSEAALQRDRIVQTLGNLTLVNKKLNPSLSNHAWTYPAAQTPPKAGKRDLLFEHSVLKLNARIAISHPYAWTEQDIAKRTELMARRICALWPRPDMPELTASAAAAAIVNGQTSHGGKYRALWVWLCDREDDELPMTFATIEKIIGQELPPSSYAHHAHWASYDGSAVVRAIHDAGWKATEVDLDGKTIVLRRQQA